MISSLPPDDGVAEYADAEISSKVSQLLIAAQNCPTWLAEEVLKARLLKVLGQLADPEEMLKQKKPLSLKEVLHDGGMSIALKLAKDLRAMLETLTMMPCVESCVIQSIEELDLSSVFH